MNNDEIFSAVNRMCSILENIYDNDLLEYCLQCLNDNCYACIENFQEYKDYKES